VTHQAKDNVRHRRRERMERNHVRMVRVPHLRTKRSGANGALVRADACRRQIVLCQ
jgi:hypothetical protein